MPPVPDKPTAAEAVAALKYLARKGFVAAVYGKIPAAHAACSWSEGRSRPRGRRRWASSAS